MHARSGGNLEVMGLMLGKVDGNTMVVMDSFALPVEGTETRVNAQAQAYEYMAAYIESAKTVSYYSPFHKTLTTNVSNLVAKFIMRFTNQFTNYSFDWLLLLQGLCLQIGL